MLSQRINRKTGKGKAALCRIGSGTKILPSFIPLIISPPHFPAMATLGRVPVELNLKTDQNSSYDGGQLTAAMLKLKTKGGYVGRHSAK